MFTLTYDDTEEKKQINCIEYKIIMILNTLLSVIPCLRLLDLCLWSVVKS